MLAEVPDWILKALNPPAEIIQFRPRPLPPNSEIARRKLDGIIRVIARAEEGNRNSLTYWGACRLAELVAEGVLTRNDAIAISVEAAGRNGLSRQEARRTTMSAFRSGGNVA